MTIKTYSNNHKEEVIELIKLNTPAYFDPSEEKEFINYLENEIEDYFVVENNSKIVGCGGINYFTEEKTARISWDIIHPDYQGKGIGEQLTEYRITLLKENKNVETIVVRTTQLVHKFYEKMDFVLDKIEKDYWANDFDLYQMTLKLTV